MRSEGAQLKISVRVAVLTSSVLGTGNSAAMETGAALTTRDHRMGEFHLTAPYSIILFFLFCFVFNFSHQHREDREQCVHAEAYSTVMLWGNSQESNMPSRQSERNEIHSRHSGDFHFLINTLTLTGLVIFSTLHAWYFHSTHFFYFPR